MRNKLISRRYIEIKDEKLGNEKIKKLNAQLTF